jgi:predicted metal-dependent hydrolase
MSKPANPPDALHTLTFTVTEYTIRRSDRARRLRIVVAPTGVEVVVPRRMALRHAEAFVAEKRPWIERTLRDYRQAEAALPPLELRDGGQIPYLGLTLPIRVNVEPWRTRAGVSRRGGKLHVGVMEPGEEAVRDALTRWYRRQARIEIAERLDWATLRAGSRYTKLQIRDPASRWASCSSTGSMSFSWRLLLAPEEVLAYVVEHEVAHLDVMDHSKRFWNIVEQRCPDYRVHERWLRSYGPALRTLL